ncbi:MAG: hypothetical protein A2254_08615, partial [Ignavibacteria bacterium RIFOXYA2_FULL_35_9]
IFISCPSSLNSDQETSKKLILKELDKQGLEPRQLGKSDYPTESPLNEVLSIAKHCAGGIILGFEQLKVSTGIRKRGTNTETKLKKPIILPTEWNHLEAGILFSLKLPILVFKEDGINGGIFDYGVTDVFIHKMPNNSFSRAEKKVFTGIFLKWQSDVRQKYYK